MFNTGPTDDSGSPIYGGSVGGYITPLRGPVPLNALAVVEYELRRLAAGNPGTGPVSAYPDGTGGIGFWLDEQVQYHVPVGSGDDGLATFTIDPVTRLVTSTPSSIPSTWRDAVHLSYSNEYTSAQFLAEYLPRINALPWTLSNGGDANHGFAVGDNGFDVTELRYRFGLSVAGGAGGATVKFRWRKLRVTGTGDSRVATWDGEETATVALAGHEGGVAWTAYQTVLVADMADNQRVKIVGPDDASYITITPEVGTVFVGGNKFLGGFHAYFTPQISSGTPPEIPVYNRETATPAPGSTIAYDGNQRVNLDGGYSTTPSLGEVIDTLSPTESRTFSSLQNGGDAARGATPAERMAQTTLLDAARREFSNGLILTLSEPVSDTATIGAALETELAARLATSGTPTDCVWAFYPQFNGSGGAPGGLVGKNWTSEDGVSFVRAGATFAVGVSLAAYRDPLSFTPPTGGTGPGTAVYLNLQFTVAWDVVTRSLADGTRSVSQETADFSHDYHDGDPPARIYGPVTTSLPAPGTEVWVENFRVSTPATITELVGAPVFEVTPAR